jgi:hypothetical protein
MKAWENDVASIERMGYPDVAKAFDAYDKFVSSGLLLYGTNVGKAAAGGEVMKRGFGVVLNESTTRGSHSLWDVVIKSARAGNPNSKAEIQALKRIVGDRGYVNGLGLYIRDSFDKAIKDKEGVQFFDASSFRDALGIGTTGSLNRLMKEALPGPTTNKLKIFDPATGIYKEFDDEVFETGVGKGLRDILGEEVPEGFIRTEGRRLPTLDELDDLTKVLEKLFENGVPSGAKFMMRRATMAGTRGAARSLLPSTAIGKGGAEAAGIIGIGPMMASVAAFLVNYGGKILTNPVSIRVLKNLTDVNLPSTIRQANFARLVRMYPEEFAAFDADLAEMEQIQKEYNKNAKINTQMKSTKQSFMEGAGDILKQGAETAGELPGMIYNSPLNPSIKDLIPSAPQQAPSQFAPEAADATPSGYDSASAGKVINQNQNFNPAAAGALYTGNTDAAIAAQYGGTQYAAGGGLMELNPVMNNQGKFVKPQMGMNDNPFAGRGIGSLS